MSSLIHLTTAESPERLIVGGDEIRIRFGGAESAGSMCALEVQMAAGGGPPMLHRHDPFELYRIEHGQLAFYIEDELGVVRRYLAGPGAVVGIPGGREHTIRNESDRQARAFVVFSPAGEMEAFARAAGALAGAEHPSPAQILELAAAHGIEITRPLETMA